VKFKSLEKKHDDGECRKKVFNIEKNIMAAGGSAIDALKQVPVVKVDQDGNLEMRGSGNIKIFINGQTFWNYCK
jgi:hypothetical protein